MAAHSPTAPWLLCVLLFGSWSTNSGELGPSTPPQYAMIASPAEVQETLQVEESKG